MINLLNKAYASRRSGSSANWSRCCFIVRISPQRTGGGGRGTAPQMPGGVLAARTRWGTCSREPAAVDVGDGWSLRWAGESQSADWSQWWSARDDPILDRLRATALAQNLDLRQAAARIDEARALRDRVAGEALPTAAAGASVNRRRQSENGPLPVGSIPGLDATQTIYDAGFDAAWEADLFGVRPVSYTHLRAHETVLYIVCSLLLEKKKENMDFANSLTNKSSVATILDYSLSKNGKDDKVHLL